MMKTQSIQYIILEQLLTENRVNQTKERYKCVPPALINYMSEHDPSGNNKYLMWMTKQLFEVDNIDGERSIKSRIGETFPRCVEIWEDREDSSFNDRFEDIDDYSYITDQAKEIIDVVGDFHKFHQALKNKDINSYDYFSLLKALEPARLKSLEKELAKDVEKIYEDEDWLILSPKSHKSSCAYGANTKWCVTMKHDSNYYNRYTQGDYYLIFVIKKKENKKWAINTSLKLTETPPEDTTINIPWHKEIEIAGSPYSVEGGGYAARERFRGSKTREKAGLRQIQNQYTDNNRTTYWDAADNQINYNQFIKESELPEKLQSLLKAVEKRVIFISNRKKRGEVAYEINTSPIRLKKGDKVRLLASGYGYFKGDEGIITSTHQGAPGRQKNVETTSAGLYKVHVPNRKPTQGYREWFVLDGERKLVDVLPINGAYLQKIEEPKTRKPRTT